MKIILQVLRIKVTKSDSKLVTYCLILERGNFDLLLQKLLKCLGRDGSSDTWKPKYKVWHFDHIFQKYL